MPACKKNLITDQHPKKFFKVSGFSKDCYIQSRVSNNNINLNKKSKFLLFLHVRLRLRRVGQEFIRTEELLHLEQCNHHKSNRG